MFGSNPSDLHVINRPVTFLAELPQAVSKSFEELCGVWHILYLWPSKQINHQQIVVFFLKTVFDWVNFVDSQAAHASGYAGSGMLPRKEANNDAFVGGGILFSIDDPL